MSNQIEAETHLVLSSIPFEVLESAKVISSHNRANRFRGNVQSNVDRIGNTSVSKQLINSQHGGGERERKERKAPVFSFSRLLLTSFRIFSSNEPFSKPISINPRVNISTETVCSDERLLTSPFLIAHAFNGINNTFWKINKNAHWEKKRNLRDLLRYKQC